MPRSLRQRPNLVAHAVGLALVGALLAALTARVACADVVTPIVEGPITLGNGIFPAATTFDLGPLGYVEREYFVSGPPAPTSMPTPSNRTAAGPRRRRTVRPSRRASWCTARPMPGSSTEPSSSSG